MKTQFQQRIARAPVAQIVNLLYRRLAIGRALVALRNRLRIANPRYSRLPVGATTSGVALVITLILLSVITFMTVTFLVISRHEGEQVDTTTQQNISKFAAEGILQQAEAQIISSIMGNRNSYNFGLMVSTNYVSPFFTNGVSSISNVNYYYANGAGLSQADQMTMLANLLYLPRAPVFITNKLLINNALVPTNEFRFYLDENGNGMFDTNGFITNQDNTEQYIPNGSGGFVTSVQVGDPEWIGFLEHPDQRHSASNFFLSRGAFIAVPIGNALDINYIHNQAKRLGAASDGFLRNQGVGSWEINLAAFLHTLNTNWDSDVAPFVAPVFSGASYTYNTNGSPSGVTSFTDAANILQYRYNGGYNQLNNFGAMYPPNGQVSPGFLFGNYYIDGYAEGPLMTNVGPLLVFPPSQPIANVWSGADNPIQIIRPRDLLTAIPSGISALNSFTNHLYLFGTNLDTYDRYTFYRMLAQMGVGSAPEPAPYPATRKINLNYANVNGTNATNFLPWTPVQFFTNAANRLLQSYYPTNFPMLVNGVVVQTNLNISFIPIYPTNYYTPAVHRLLQLAANIYDASTNKSGIGPSFFDFPSVFRPYFVKVGSGANTVVYINGYRELTPTVQASDTSFLNPPLDLRRPNDLNTKLLSFDTVNNVYGVPYVIGARPNLPNFNQFCMAPVVQMTRALQVIRTNGGYLTNVSYQIGISNVMGVQCWNSYTNYYGRPVTIVVTNDYSIMITNNFGAQPAPYTPVQPVGMYNYVTNWAAGYVNTLITNSFQVQLTNTPLILPNDYVQLNPPGYGSPSNSPVWNSLRLNPATGTYLQPDWGVLITNRVRVIIQDYVSGRILDYVQLGGLGQIGGPDSWDDVVTNLASLNIAGSGFNNFWNTGPESANNPLPIGFYVQYQFSMGVSNNNSFWNSVSTGFLQPGGSVATATAGFRNFFTINTNSPSIQFPFSPTTTYASIHTWSANDPLIHYMVGDLTDLNVTNGTPPTTITTGLPTNVLYALSVKVAPRYRPWYNMTGMTGPLQPITINHVAYADPQITQSQDWQFPTNKYPNVGWLGRVHRGTPWQTVYLKSSPVSMTPSGVSPYSAWQVWTGNSIPWPGNPAIADAAASQPTSDWQLLDLFTTAPNDNASRGQLSVNQTNFAAWAAVLDGVMVLSNNPVTKTLTAMSIDTTQPGVLAIITNIYSARTNLVNQGQVFTSMGQVLSAPQLTVSSPYITQNDADTNLTDAVYERIPQQIMGLLRTGSPRYAIYAYGQALKPAPNSIVQSGQFFGMCTNYQITGEVLTRTIVRFDNAQSVPGSLTNAQGAQIAPHAVVESYQILSPDQ